VYWCASVGVWYDVAEYSGSRGESRSGQDRSHAGTRVRLTVDPAANDSVQVMPDVRGLSARQAMLWLTQQGVKVTVKGTGTVQRQSTKAGEPLPAEAVLQCI